ncbi:MAG TPA: hypothetical protein VIV11_23230 [Kofleriaceae bacterium]
MIRALALVLGLVLVGCATLPKRQLCGSWPSEAYDYDLTTQAWTAKTRIADVYQEILELAAVFKSPQWRAAYANRDAYFRKLEGPQREARMAQAKAETEGPYEVALLVTTWDRRENDLDRGEKSIWRIVLVDEAGNEIKPLEIVKDKRPAFTVRADYPEYGDFATAYTARFPRDKELFGPGVQRLRLRMSGVRGGAEVTWTAQQSCQP